MVKSDFYTTLPDEVKALLNEIVSSTKGQPWFRTAECVENLAQLFVALPSEESGITVKHAQDLFEQTVTVLLEMKGANPRVCQDPFQVPVYRSASNKTFVRAADRYEKRMGGKAAIQKAMQEWIEDNNPEPSVIALKGFTLKEPDGQLSSLPELLDGCERYVRNEIQANGEVEYKVIYETIAGARKAITCPAPKSQRAKEQLVDMAGELMKTDSAVQFAVVAEVWIAPTGGVRPTDHPERREAVHIIAFTEEGNVVRTLDILRKGDTVSLGEPKDDGKMTAYLWEPIWKMLNEQRTVH